MKYIKTIEKIIHDVKPYQVGDYVYISPIYFSGRGNKLVPGKLIEASNPGFMILFLTGKPEWITTHMIFNRMNKEQIEDFELQLSSNKYNL